MASYVCPEEARRFASVTEAERQEQRRREREIDEDLFGMILGKYNDRETYFASYDWCWEEGRELGTEVYWSGKFWRSELIVIEEGIDDDEK